MTDDRKISHALIAANIPFAATSWNGFNAYGDAKSIEEISRIRHEAGTVPDLKAEILRLRAALTTGKCGGEP